MDAGETEIIRRIIGGETKLFRHLVRSYDGMVFSLAFEICGDGDTARDITQEAFIKAFDHLADYDPSKGRFSTWLCTIAYNLAIMNQRKQRRRLLTIGIDYESFSDIDDESVDAYFKDVEDSGEERLVRLAEAVDKLPPDDRLILTLFYREDLSLAEIGEVVGARAGTIATRLSRIRKRLYALLKNKE